MFSNGALQKVNQAFFSAARGAGWLSRVAISHTAPGPPLHFPSSPGATSPPRAREMPRSSSPSIAPLGHLPSLDTPLVLQHVLPEQERASPVLDGKCTVGARSLLPSPHCSSQCPDRRRLKGVQENLASSARKVPAAMLSRA